MRAGAVSSWSALSERNANKGLRRTRESVRLDRPPRTVEIVRIAPTAEQKSIHDAHMQTVAQIVRKPYLTEMDLMRLRMALLMCRMAADSSCLVDKQSPTRSSKLERLGEIFDSVVTERDRRVVLFSEWTSMLDLIEPLLEKRKLGYVRLDGSVPQKKKKKQALVSRFQSETRFASFSRRTRAVPASIFRRRTRSSTSTCRGTPQSWSSALRGRTGRNRRGRSASSSS